MPRLRRGPGTSLQKLPLHPIWLSFVGVCIAGAALIALSLWSLWGYKQSADDTLDSVRANTLLDSLLIETLSAETGHRGYVLTGEEIFLDLYESGVRTVAAQREQVDGLPFGTAEGRSLLTEVGPLIDAKLANMAATVELRRAGRGDEATARIATGEGKALMDELRAKVARLDSLETDEVEAGIDTADRRATFAALGLIALSATTAWILFWVYRSIRRRGVEESLRETNRTKDEFLGLVSHELRTATTVIIGNARLLERGDDVLSAEERVQSHREIRAEGERMQQIVENMLTLSRTAVDDAHNTEPVLLGRVIDAAVSRHRAYFPGSAIAVRTAPRLPPVLGNASYIDQVVQNLLTNARKYASAVEPIEIISEADGARVTVSVLDRGRGIAPERQEQIFEPFVRLPSATTAREGVGLGLPVCRRLLRAQGGDISVASRPGGGSVFTFWLSVAPDPEGAGVDDGFADGNEAPAPTAEEAVVSS